MGDRGKRLEGRAAGRVVCIRFDRAVGVLDREKIYPGGVVREDRLAAEWIRHLDDPPARIVGNLDRLPVGMGQARQKAASVAGGDPVSIGISDVID